METKEDVKESNKPSLMRALYIVLFLIVGRFVSMIVCFVAIFQFIYSLMFDKPNEKVLEFTKSLSEFAKEIIGYVSFNTQKKPWPIGDWPKD